ncbi:MAG TPA: GMC family oxidoreductase N-terminal domain-containing protein, partial [Steroidobacteraceae bacterium]
LLGYGVDWPIDWREMWGYYREVEEALSISGPVNYPWGPKRPRYPYRAHELNAAALALAEGCEALGIPWTETPLATLSAPRGRAHPCVYRGFCVTGCSTNAKQSALVTWIPRAVAAGAEIRDLAMAGRIEVRSSEGHSKREGVTDGISDRAIGVHYVREGRWRFQRARNVIVAGYAIETPRLLFNSATARCPHGLANRSGLVGKYFTVQANQAVWGLTEREIRGYKGPPSLALTEHWNYCDAKDFFGGYCYMSQGPLPQLWARVQSTSRGLWGERLIRAMHDYNHQVGQDRRGVPGAGEQPRHARRRQGSVRPADPSCRVHVVRQRQGADRARARVHAACPGGDRRDGHLGAGRRHVPHGGHVPHGRRSVDECRRFRLPQLGHP